MTRKCFVGNRPRLETKGPAVPVSFRLCSVLSLFITGVLIILFGTRAETMLIFFRSSIVHCNSSILRLRITVSLAPGDVLGVTAVKHGFKFGD